MLDLEKFNQSYKFEQLCKVVSDEWDGDDFGNEWPIHYVVYATCDDEGTPCFDLYSDDGKGNGDMECRSYNERRMVSICLKLGYFVEWKKNVPVNWGKAA